MKPVPSDLTVLLIRIDPLLVSFCGVPRKKSLLLLEAIDGAETVKTREKISCGNYGGQVKEARFERTLSTVNHV